MNAPQLLIGRAKILGPLDDLPAQITVIVRGLQAGAVDIENFTLTVQELNIAAPKAVKQWALAVNPVDGWDSLFTFGASAQASWRPHLGHFVFRFKSGDIEFRFTGVFDPESEHTEPDQVATAIAEAGSNIRGGIGEAAHRLNEGVAQASNALDDRLGSEGSDTRQVLNELGGEAVRGLHSALAYPFQTQGMAPSAFLSDGDGFAALEQSPGSWASQDSTGTGSVLSRFIGRPFPVDPTAADIDSLWAAIDQRIVPDDVGELRYEATPVTLITAAGDGFSRSRALVIDSARRCASELAPYLREEHSVWRPVATPRGGAHDIPLQVAALRSSVSNTIELIGRPGQPVVPPIRQGFEQALDMLACLGERLRLTKGHIKRKGGQKCTTDAADPSADSDEDARERMQATNGTAVDDDPGTWLARALRRFAVDPEFIDSADTSDQAAGYTLIATRLIQLRAEFDATVVQSPRLNYAGLAGSVAQNVVQVAASAQAWKAALESVRIVEPVRVNTSVGDPDDGVTVQYLVEKATASADATMPLLNTSGDFGLNLVRRDLDEHGYLLVAHEQEVAADAAANGLGALDAGYRTPRVAITLNNLINAYAESIAAVERLLRDGQRNAQEIREGWIARYEPGNAAGETAALESATYGQRRD